MAYIGAEPVVSATRTLTEVIATAGQTVFTANGGYTVGYVDVIRNGSQLNSADYTATDGSTITLANPAFVNDEIKIVAWGTFSTATALTSVNPVYTGTLTGGTGVVNLGSGQFYKDASGNVGIGTAISGNNTNGFVFLKNWYSGGDDALIIGHPNGTSSGGPYLAFNYNGSQIGSITQTGTTAVLYNTTSDYRLKENVKPIQNALATIKALNPVSFTWVDGRPDDGFLAHEIQAVIPNCVTGEKDAVNEDGTPKYQQMDSSGVIPFLVKAIQELKAELDATKAEVALLKGTN